MGFRRRLSTRQREALYERSRGDKDFPDCNLCELPITPDQSWDESHHPVAHAFGGTETGVAHRKCNREHGAKVVTPAAAKATRVRQKDRDIYRPRQPMPGGRDDPRKRTMAGIVVDRATGARWGKRAEARS